MSDYQIFGSSLITKLGGHVITIIPFPRIRASIFMQIDDKYSYKHKRKNIQNFSKIIVEENIVYLLIKTSKSSIKLVGAN